MAIRAIRAAEALKTPGGITARRLAEKLDIEVRSAYRYIDYVSLALPVQEHGKNPRKFEIKEVKNQ